MTLSRRLLLILVLMLGLGSGMLALGGHYHVRQWVEANLLQSAERVRNVLMATRRIYHHQFIDSGLPINDKTLGFLPAHALHRISKDLHDWDKSGFSFNNVSDQPRNPFNKADAIEMAAIEHFRAHPQEELRFVPFTNAAGQSYYLYARPIRVEKYCLQCHGRKEDAPETIRLNYDEAFGYQEGDLRGILSIKVPAAPLAAQAQASLLALLGVGIVTLGLLGIGIAWAVGRHVIRPLTVLEDHIRVAGGGDLSKRIVGLTGEFAQVGEAYNRMAISLATEHAQHQESEARFRTIFEQSALGLALVGIDGRWLRVNHTLCRMLGYDEAELLGKTIQDVSCPEDLPADLLQIKRMLNREIDNYSIEKRYIRKDGQIFWSNLTVALVWKDHGIPDYFISAIQDISKQKAAELARQHSEDARRVAEKSLIEAQLIALTEQQHARRAALSLMEDAQAARQHAEGTATYLKQSEERFRALVEQSLAGIYIIQGGYFRYVNPGFAAIFGYGSPAELIDEVPVDALVSSADRDRVADNIQRRVDGHMGEIQYTFKGLRRDGTLIDVEVHGRLFAYQDKPAVIGLILDVTARKRVEEELRTRNEELERFNQAMIGRELDMIELKQRINALSLELGRAAPYDLSFLDLGARQNEASHED